MSFPRGGTPTFELTIPPGYEDLTAVENLTVDIVSKSYTVTKTGNSVTVTGPNSVEVLLTQEESLSLAGSTAEIQMNWTYPNSSLRWATDIAIVGIDRQLHLDVIPRQTGGGS